MRILGLVIGLSKDYVDQTAFDGIRGAMTLLERTANDAHNAAVEDGKTISTLRGQNAKHQDTIDTLEAHIKQLNSAHNTIVSAFEAREARAQSDRIAHNDLLLAAGKAFTNLKAAWQFRLDNPKMGPLNRIVNNETLSASINDLDTHLPKKIQDPNVGVDVDPVDPNPKVRRKPEY